MQKQWYDRLKEKREGNGLTLKEVANEIYTTQPTLISYEQGVVFPKIDILMKICDLYKTSVNYILYGNEIGLKFENANQKVISNLIGLYVNDKLIFDKETNSFKFKDTKICNLLRHCIEYIDENDKSDIDTIANLINGLNKIK